MTITSTGSAETDVSALPALLQSREKPLASHAAQPIEWHLDRLDRLGPCLEL